MKQLTLAIQPTVRNAFDNYLGRSNVPVVCALQELLTGDGEQQIYIWTPRVLGKSHLMQALCHEAGDRGLRCAYIPLAQFIDRSWEIFEGLELMDLVCIDDAHLAFGNEDWEEALFDLINRCRELHSSLVIAAAEHPDSDRLQLPDLRSRLLWGPVFRLQDLDDSEKCLLLQEWLKERGLGLDEAAADYLLRHSQRDLGSLHRVLKALDQESLVQKRALSVPFIREVLAEDSRI